GSRGSADPEGSPSGRAGSVQDTGAGQGSGPPVRLAPPAGVRLDPHPVDDLSRNEAVVERRSAPTSQHCETSPSAGTSVPCRSSTATWRLPCSATCGPRG